MGATGQGARVAQLEKFLGVNHETAVNMAKRIREAIKQDPQFIQRCLEIGEPALGSIAPPTPNRNQHPTLHAVLFKFRTEALTREHVARIRWPKGPTCPGCQKPNVRKVKSKCRRNRHLYWCLACKKQFSVTSGHRDLHGIRNLSEWFIALYLIESTTRGIRAKQLERLLGINYRTAVKLITWFQDNEERRKLLFDLYVGQNDPAEFFKAREAIKRDRVLIAEQKGKSL
jgi:transposase-like protein